MWADWDDLAVLYHRPSGKTHFINASTAFLLEHLVDTPVGIEAATQALAAAQGAVADEALREEVAATLLRLEELGLIERA
ncbi:MAG: hypothetical protein AMXMBFR37_06060 [Steroidobacteraceae bacterium]